MVKRKNIFSLVMAFMLLFLGTVGSVVGAEAVEADFKTNVHIHKLEYDLPDSWGPGIQSAGTPAGPEDKPIYNEGGELDIADYGARPYDKSVSGDVGFTLYKADEEGIAEFADDGTVSDANMTAQGTEVLVDDAGKVTFPELSRGLYIVKETTSPFKVIEEDYIYLSLPVTNESGDGYLSDVNIYPKNWLHSLDISINKIGIAHDILAVETGSVLEGISFQLYKGQPGEGTVVGDALVTDGEGNLSFNNLPIGDYYIVEIADGAKVVDDYNETLATGEEDQPYLSASYAQNNEHNLLKFSVTGADGIVPGSDLIEIDYGSVFRDASIRILNFSPPRIKKELDVDDLGYELGEEATFTSTVIVPPDADNYSTFVINDTVDTRTEYVADSLEIKKGATTLVEGTDYTIVSSDATGFKVEFKNNTQEWDIYEIAPAYELTLSYKVKLTSDTDFSTTPYVNNTNIDFNRDSHAVMENGSVATSDSLMKVYGKKFQKVDAGLFGTGVDRSPLAGAQFNLKKDVEGQTLYMVEGEGGVPEWSSDETKTKVVYTSGDDGKFEITALKIGSYALEEVVAPEGFELSLDDYNFEVTATSYEEEALDVENNKKPDMPMTGKEITVLVAGGVLLLAIAGGVVLFTRKKRENGQEG